MRILRPIAAAVLLHLSMTSPAASQVRASERAEVRQTIDGTVLTIGYSRPLVRGRSPLFGKVVEWGEVWTPGANWATTLEVSRDVTIDGHTVPKGKYSLWFVVRPKEWTVVLDPRVELYHADHPDSTAQQLRWQTVPGEGPQTEVLTWSFPDVRPDGGSLSMQWGTTRIALDAMVQPSHPLTIARADVEPYLGHYEFRLDPTPGDSSTKADTLEFYYESGSLRQRAARKIEWYPLLMGSTMVRINDDWFIPTIIRNGRIWEMASDMVYEFQVVGGRATAFEMRDDKDVAFGHGRRIDRP